MTSEERKDALESTMQKNGQCFSTGSIEAASKRNERIAQLEEIEMISYYDKGQNWKNKVIKQDFQSFHISHCLIDMPYQALYYYFLLSTFFVEK